VDEARCPREAVVQLEVREDHVVDGVIPECDTKPGIVAGSHTEQFDQNPHPSFVSGRTRR